MRVTEVMWSNKDEIDFDFRILVISNREKPEHGAAGRCSHHFDVFVSDLENTLYML